MEKSQRESEAANVAKTEFLSTMSHELRTPLTSIKGSLGLIQGGAVGELPEKAGTLVDMACRNADRLVRLINDILDIDKIEAGQMAFDLKVYDICELTSQSIAVNKGFASENKVELVFNPPSADEFKANVFVDADRYAQVMANLISNAAKFSPDHANITITVEQQSSNVRVSIIDKGLGISEEFQKLIFQKFCQEDSSDTRKAGGTGLGLSITKAIVERLGGNIGFETMLGEGTTFYVELPIAVDDDISNKFEQVLLNFPADSGQLDGHRGHVLILEDDHEIAHLLDIMLRQKAFKTTIVYSAEEAKKVLSKQSFNVMTVDIVLPGQDGLSFISELRQQEKNKNLPIVIISAKAKQAKNKLASSIALNVSDWIEKPIDSECLLKAINNASKDINKSTEKGAA